MLIKQISLFIENRSGRLDAACHALGDQGINILALSLADTADFGILRLIVSDPDAGLAALKDAGFTTVVNDVLAVEMEDRPGSLAKLLDVLSAKDINIEYMYAFSSVKTDRAALIFRFEDNETAMQALQERGFNVMSKIEVLGD